MNHLYNLIFQPVENSYLVDADVFIPRQLHPQSDRRISTDAHKYILPGAARPIRPLASSHHDTARARDF